MKVTRYRVESFLSEHGIILKNIADVELTQLTRKLSNRNEDEAREILKRMIIHYRKTGVFNHKQFN